MYFSSTAVFLAEVVKLLVTLVVIFFQRGNLRQFVSFLVDNLLTDPMAAIKLSVPSVLYVIQNNLVYLAMTHLESTTFQVGYQFKGCLHDRENWVQNHKKKTKWFGSGHFCRETVNFARGP